MIDEPKPIPVGRWEDVHDLFVGFRRCVNARLRRKPREEWDEHDIAIRDAVNKLSVIDGVAATLGVLRREARHG